MYSNTCGYPCATLTMFLVLCTLFAHLLEISVEVNML